MDSPTDGPEVSVPPAQLPSDLARFTGRDAELTQLNALLSEALGAEALGAEALGAEALGESEALGETARAVVISALSGTAGVGKSALAVHWAHQVRGLFPDGQLYLNLRGFDPGVPAVQPGEALCGLLDGLGVPPQRIPADLASRAALYRSVLAGRRMLILLDNAGDAGQVRPLLPGEPGCVVVVTSRNQLASLIVVDGAQPLLLDVLNAGEARALLAGRIGEDRVTAEPQAIDDIVAGCARLPLALAIIAARAATHSGFSLATIAAELSDAHSRLDLLTGSDPATDVRAVFLWSYRKLPPETARVFRLLGLHPAPSAGLGAVASLAGLPAVRVRRLLNELCNANMIAEQLPGRFGCHNLLREYARDLAEETDSRADRHAATVRVLDHYLHTALAANSLLKPGGAAKRGRPPSAAVGVTLEPMPDSAAAIAWFTTEQRVLRAAVEHAAVVGLDRHAWWLSWALTPYFDRRWDKQNWLACQETALAAANSTGDLNLQSDSHFNLGYACRVQGYLDRSRAHLTTALGLFHELGDVGATAHVHLNLGIIARRQGRHQEALDEGTKALSLYRQVDYQQGQAAALNNLGWCHIAIGDYDLALRYCRRAVAIHQTLGDGMGAAHSLDSAGKAHHHLGAYDEALACYHSALRIFRDQRDRQYEAVILTHIGDAHHASGHRLAASDAWRQALSIFTEIDHLDADEVRAKLTETEGTRARPG